MENRKIIIIGAGPSGLAAALSALNEGASVLILEHMPEPGLKLLITGNGQCNLSNTEVGPEHYHGCEDVIRSVLRKFSFNDMISFMKEISVETETLKYRFEDCGYLYPSDHKALSVRNRMVQAVIARGGKIVTDCNIKGIRETLNGFDIETDLGIYSAERLIFATGSNACPKTGSDSSIYPVLKSLGIIQKTWLPALVALKSDSVLLKTLAGYRADASVRLTDCFTGQKFSACPGEIQFREHYISGLPVIQLSRYASAALHENHSVILSVNMTKANNKDRILPIESADFNITGTEGFEKAICCSGGVSGDDIDADTLECNKVKHIYFAGEMIDVDGDCGGFNLHFAFASGVLAGRSAAG